MAARLNDGHNLTTILLPKPALAGFQSGTFLFRCQRWPNKPSKRLDGGSFRLPGDLANFWQNRFY